MARFKRRAKARRSYGFKKSKSRNSSAGFNATKTIVGGAIYGASRQYVSNLVSPLTSKIPLGNVADNLVMGAICYFGAKKAPAMLKDAFKAGLAIEAALAGQDLMANGFNTGTSSSDSNFDSSWG